MCRKLLTAALCLISFAAAQNLMFGTRQARDVPSWLAQASIYEIWLNTFSAAGTLRGAIPRLSYVADLGATILYVGPIAKISAIPDASPYSVADYNAIDPQYGDEGDLHAFVTEAHRLGLRVMLDVVYYHSAPDSNMRSDSDFFVRTPDGRTARGFWPQPLPDFTNTHVRQYLIGSLVHWVRDFKVDGFRCDVGGGVPVAFWEEARQALDKVDRHVVLLSESDRPDDQLHAFDINYNFQYYLTLRSVMNDGTPALSIREAWERMRGTMPQGARLLHYSDNHDWPRAVTQFGEKGALACSVLNFTLDGIPFIFNGQEIGDTGQTVWRKHAPISWPPPGARQDERTERLARYKKLFALRKEHPAFTSGELIWVNNTEPASVLSFLRKTGREEVLVIINLSNRQLSVTLDLPVMDYYVIDNLLEPGQTWFQLYSGRVSASLAAFSSVVGKRKPLQPLTPTKR